MIPTLPSSSASICYSETPEAKAKIVSVAVALQHFLPARVHDTPDQLLDLLNNEHQMDLHVEVGRLDPVDPKSGCKIRLAVLPKQGTEALIDGCELAFEGRGRDVSEAWGTITNRVKGLRL